MIRDWKRESGSVVTEASVVLPVFFIAVMLIVNFINIFSLHNKIQFAINSVAHEIAGYSYISSALNIHQTVNGISEDGNDYTERIDHSSNDILECIGSIQTLKGDTETLVSQVTEPDVSQQGVEDVVNQGKQVVDDVNDVGEKAQEVIADGKDIMEHPKETLIGAGYIGYDALLYTVRNGIGAVTAEGLIGKHLTDEYLEAYGVSGALDFSDSSVFNDENSKMVDIVVKYDVDLSVFGVVFREKNPKLSFVQRVTVPAWLDGDGQPVPDK